MEDKRQRLIRLFTFEKPHALRYRRRATDHKEDKPELSKMIKEGLVKVEEVDTKYITYRYNSRTVS